MNIWTILIADPIPPGDTFLVAMMRATSAAGLVKVPGGGKVDSVLMVRAHLRIVMRPVDLEAGFLAEVFLVVDFMDE
jgi:hypothetical protein